MMQPATRQSVEGNFAPGQVVLHGSTYRFRESAGSYFITESDLTGRSWEHRVEYTLGLRRVQHYITTLPDGRMILIPAAWDNVAKKWVHDVDLDNPEEASADRILIWNKTCYPCHATGEQKNFDPGRSVYHTTWRDPGVSCESCHGPGKEHSARPAKATIVNPARLDAMRGIAVCAQCHSFRNIYVDGFQAGADYSDYYLPVLEYSLGASDDPAYWADGRPRWFANEAGALWQSQCFLQGGATCLTCHSQPHNPDVDRDPRFRPADNRLCAGCHQALAAKVAAHSHHAAASAGSSCVGCHMPPSVTGLRAQFRDHSMSVPDPANSLRHGIPNACNLCHRDRDAGWALQQMNAWSGSRPLRRTGWADAFALARGRNPGAIPALLEILSDAAAGPWTRANAAGYLGGFPEDPSAYGALVRALSDRDPLVRATAATAIRPAPGQKAESAAEIAELLKDPVRTVRMSAGIALVMMGVQPLPGEVGVRFEQAKDQYRARAALYADDAGQQFAAGRFFLLAGDMDRAVAALRATLKLDPAAPVQYLLARSLAVKGDFSEARQVLRTIPRNAPDYTPAQKLLAQIEAKESSPGAAQPDRGAPPAAPAGEAQFLDGQVQFNRHFYQAAWNDFDQALRLSPQAEWAGKARVYRAICLEKLGRTGEAEAAIGSLDALAAARQDVDLQLAYVELLFDTGRVAEAEKRTAEVIAAAPGAPLAYFWRAKVLLQLQRVTEAADAAEQSIRLEPQLPQAHNLLVRIYQIEGRAKEAAQQAEWLRDYERRTHSH